MVTRSEWVASVLRAWRGEPCPRCGRDLTPYMVDEDGDVWAYCRLGHYNTTVATEHWPARFDPDPDEANDLPF